MLGNPGWRLSEIEVLITRACEPSLHEPNYAAHLEIAEYIEKKKANVPREAAMTIARLSNNRNPHIAILALALLNTLVQSCGYPFHLQISTKEFLNELVRRFPERPPPFPGPVMSRILDLIHSWKEGICATSRWKEDLGNIRDMHRLLTFKGYRFRDLPMQPSAPSTANLKSADELEAEDREAQSAKLQELIRRGTPRDLAAAQELMKSLAGADPEAKPDYRSQSLRELAKLEQKVVLLNEMLDNADTANGERTVSGDVYEQVASLLSSARPKIQKWVSDAESDDPESLDTFLQINDAINNALTRYEAFKRGDYVAARNPIPSELQAPSSLIEFDDAPTAAPISNAQKDDLMGLFNSSAPVPSTAPSISFGGFAPAIRAAISSPSPMPSNGTPFSTMSPSTPLRPGTMSPPASIMLPTTPKLPSTSASSSNGTAPNYFNSSPAASGIGLGGLNMRVTSGNSSMFNLMQPPSQPQNQQQLWNAGHPQVSSQTTNTTNPVQGKDPFADLAGLF